MRFPTPPRRADSPAGSASRCCCRGCAPAVGGEGEGEGEGEEEVQVEYVSAAMDDEDPSMAEFKAIFEKFATPEELTKAKEVPVKVKEVNMEDAMAAALGVVGGDADGDGELSFDDFLQFIQKKGLI